MTLDLNRLNTESALLMCCTAASWLLGGFDESLIAMLILYLVDFALGFTRAVWSGKYSSVKFRHGLNKGIVYCVAVFAANMVDVTLDKPIPFICSYFRAVLVASIAAHEFLSIADHFAEMKIHVIPRQITDRIKSFRDNVDPIQNRSGSYGTSNQHDSSSLLGLNLGGRGSDQRMASGEGMGRDRVSRGVPERPPHKPRRI